MEFCVEDCRALLEKQVLTVENSRIRRRFAVRPEGLLPLEVRDLRSGQAYRSEKELPVIPSGFGSDEAPKLRLEGGPSGKGFAAALSYTDGDCSAVFRFFLAPKLPFCSLERTFLGDWTFPEEDSDAGQAPNGIAPTGIWKPSGSTTRPTAMTPWPAPSGSRSIQMPPPGNGATSFYSPPGSPAGGFC